MRTGAKLILGDFFRNRRERGVAGLPVMSVTQSDGLVDRARLDRKTESGLSPEEHLLICKGDIAYNMMRMWQGASGLALHDGLVSPAYVVLAPRGGVDPRFASYWFKSPRMIHLFWAYSYGLTEDRLRLYYKDFARIPVSPPCLEEQRLIAVALSVTDQAILLAERLVEAKRKFRTALLERVLTGSLRFARFETPGTSKCPPKWSEARLGDIAAVNPPCHHKLTGSDEVTFLSMSDVSETGGIASRQLRTLKSVSQGYKAFQEGDILVAKITPCFQNGKVAICRNLRNGHGYASTEFHVLRPSPEVDTHFLYYTTMLDRFRQRGVASMTGSAGQKRVPAEFLRSFPMRLPPLVEQQRISEAIRCVDSRLSTLGSLLTCLFRQRSGLMQRLFSGQLRQKVSP